MSKVPFFVFVIILFGSFADASVILYEDNFDGSGAVNLHGLPPDIDNNGGGNTWIAHSDWKANGTAGPYSSATLPFAPTAGKIYRLTARFKNVIGNEDWLAVGFAAGSSTDKGTNDDRFISGDTAGQPWMLRRGDAAAGNDQTFTGPGTVNGQGISNTLERSSDVDFQIILDTKPAQWRSVWYQKLTTESEYATVRDFTYSTNPSIGAVGLACANVGTTGNIDYFLLEEIELSITAGGQPLDALVFEGETATFQVTFVSDDPPSVTWYRSEGTGDTPVDTEDPNVTVTVDYDAQADEYATELEMQNAGNQDEGIYYCVISNDDYISIQSNNATLGVKRLVAHWSLDEADYDGNYVDTVAGYIAQPANEPNFVTGVRDEPDGAVMITASSGWGVSEIFALDGMEGFTICFWVDWNGDWEQTVDVNDLIVESEESETEYVVTNGLKANERWQHVCISYDGSAVRVYLNGRLKLSEVDQFPSGTEAVIEIGNSLREQIFNGAVDDIRLYDYALSQTEIIQLVTGKENCIQEYSLEYDFSGPYGVADCVVDLYDLAEFTKHWLESCTSGYGQDYDFSGPGDEPDCVVNFYDLAEFCKHWLESGLL